MPLMGPCSEQGKNSAKPTISARVEGATKPAHVGTSRAPVSQRAGAEVICALQRSCKCWLPGQLASDPAQPDSA